MTGGEPPEAVTLGGVELRLVSDAEMLRARVAPVKPIQLCVRVADVDPTPLNADHGRRRQQLPCERCGQLCWFDPKAGPGRLFVRLLCIQCLGKKVAEAKRKGKEATQ